MAKSSKQLTRRSFLASTALAAGAMAAAGMAGCTSTTPTEEPEPSAEPEGEQTQPVEEDLPTYISTCRGNCGGRCALQAKVRDGKIVSTFPMHFPGYEGVEQGCAKGMSNPLRIYGTNRLMYPMKRAGERGSGEWEQITWDEAFELIAEKMQAAIDEYGPASICFQGGAGNMSGYLHSSASGIVAWLPSFSKGVGCARFIQKTGATAMSVGHDMAGIYFCYYLLQTPTHYVEDLQYAKTLVCWGANPAEASFNRNAWWYCLKAKESGATMITIDPLFTPTAAHSDMWVPVRTGTDAALMNAMSNYIIANGLQNDEYLKNGSIAPLLVKEDGKYLRLSDLGQATAGEDDDVPVVWDEDAQAFVAHTEAKNPAINGTFDANGVSVRTILDVAVENIAPYTVEFAANECGIPAEQIEEIATKIATEGPTSLYINYGLEHTYESWRIYYAIGLLVSLTGCCAAPGAAYGGSIGLDTSTSSIWKKPPKVDLSMVKLEDAVPNANITGDYIVEITESGQWQGEDFPIRVMYNITTDPIDNFQGATDMLKAYEKIDFIVTAELIMTTTCHYSDLVLPATMPWEDTELINNGMFCQKAIEPVGDALGDFDIFVGIANAMGFDDLYPKTGEEYLRQMLDTPENIEAGCGYDDLSAAGVIIDEYQSPDPTTKETNKLGRTQFYLESMLPRDLLGVTFEMKDRLPSYAKSIEAYAENPDREKYPLYGMSSHDFFHGQTLWPHNAWLDYFRKVDGKPFCRIHEEAAAERGIETGDTVRVYNDHGSVTLKAVVTKGIQKETVWLPHGFIWDEFDEGFAQSLTRHCPDPVSSNNNFNDWICQVEKVGGAA